MTVMKVRSPTTATRPRVARTEDRPTPSALVPLRNPEPDDAELVTRALLGERWARAALYHRHARDIANLALSLLRDREEARDVLQDTFVTAFETLSQLRERTKVRAWLCKVAVRHVQRRFRRRRLRRLLGLDFGAPVTIPLDELAMRDAEQEAVLELRRLEAVLRTLPDRACIVWTLRAVEGETLPAIAEIVGCSLATVKRDLSAAQHAIGEATEGEP